MKSATQLFSKHGIDRVSVDMVASEANVSTPTVYQNFKSKTGLLISLMENVLFDAKSMNLSSRVDELASAIEIIEMTAEIARTIYENENHVLGIVRGSSTFSPELKQAEKDFEDIRFKMQKSRCEKLGKMKALQTGMKVYEARQLMWMYTSREIFRMLVIEQKWSSEKYKDWLSATLYSSLISNTES
ncbi:MAG: helix-turn-helix transcriptional regulator [Bdellovibrionales bacterium]|nr:helix-turn-helix transcriptional regulator [Bdellovibrionales bacterium]